MGPSSGSVPGAIHIHVDVPEPEAAQYAWRVLLAGADAPVFFHRGAPSGLSRDATLISYGTDPVAFEHCRQLVIPAATRLWEHYGRESSLPRSPLGRLPLEALHARPSERLRDPLVLPYVSDARPPEAEVVRDAATGSVTRIVTGADIVASTFFWISRYEETLIRERDEFGRLPQKLFRAVAEGIADRPLVDEYAALLEGWLEALGANVRFRREPFRAFVTHDVDSGIGVRGFRENAENALRTFYREAIRGRRLGTGLIGLADGTRRAFALQSEADLFARITKLDARFGFPSFFFLMANGTHRVDASYDILGPASRDVIAAIRAAGGRIGLHVGLDAHRSAAGLRAEWNHLRQADPAAWPATRCHFLAFYAPSTWRSFCELGIRVDSTLGYSDHMGFGGGTCRPFRPFDVERRETLPIWEVPMTLMDNNFFRQPARDDAERISRVRDLVSRVRAHGGCFVVNWHNVVFSGHYRRAYLEILGLLRGAEPLRLEGLPEDGRLIG